MGAVSKETLNRVTSKLAGTRAEGIHVRNIHLQLYTHTHRCVLQFSVLSTMTRGRTMFSRAARRVAMEVPKLHRANRVTRNPSDDPRCICPYCKKILNSVVGRNRHIVLRPHCRAAHLGFVNCRKRRKRKRKVRPDEPSSGSTGNEPLEKRIRRDEERSPVAGPSRLPIPNPNPASSNQDGVRRASSNSHCGGGVFVEQFPIDNAGVPIGTRRRNEGDLGKYLRSCGLLGDQDGFRTAEILMTTGLTGRGRTTHLKGPMVSIWDMLSAHANKLHSIKERGCGGITTHFYGISISYLEVQSGLQPTFM